MASVLMATLLLFAAYSFASSASLISEKSGVANISIEGNMVLGAILYAVFMDVLNNPSSIDVATGAWAMATPFVSMVLAGFFTGLFSMLFAMIVVKTHGDQIITGTGVNLLTPALAVFIGFVVFGSAGNAPVHTPIELTGNAEWIYPAISAVVAILLVGAIAFYLNRTKSGLRIKAAGENPYALETAGVSVARARLKVLFVAGILSGIAGTFWVQSQTGGFMWTVFGAGYMAIGIVIFSQWKAKGILPGSLVIAFLTALAMNYLSVPALADLDGLPLLILRITPYILPLLVLMFVKGSSGPKKLGKPFKKDQR